MTTTITATEIVPSVWLGCLSCYNGGHLVGEWMSPETAANATPASIHHGADFVRMHRDEAEGFGPHEELWVMDSEWCGRDGEFGPLECREIADAFEAVGSAQWLAWLAFRSLGMGDDVESFEESFQGEHQSREDFAQELAEDIGAVDDDASWPNNYIDWARAARDLFMDYSDVDAPGGIYVFRSV